MKRSSATLKTLARKSLNGNYGIPILAYLIITALTVVVSMLVTGFLDVTSMTSIITNQILLYMLSLLMSLCNAGYSKLILSMNRKQPYTVGNLFYVFSHNPDRFLVVNLLLLVGQLILSLPLEILSYTSTGTASLYLSLFALILQALMSLLLGAFFGLANYLLLDNPEIGAIDSLKESLRLMKGNKGRYFYIQFSFIPLNLACLFTCYIGLLWLMPYIQTTMVYFYMDITGELDAPEIITEPPVDNPSDSFTQPPFS